jgi:polyisoprenyl-phosphate glycosyltransferase
VSRASRELSLLSVVAPVFDEEETVRAFCERTVVALEGLPFELILVNDGSSDGTASIIDELAAADTRIRVITLSRNFGHQRALTAGLEHAAGDAVVMIDSDLQDPPELIPDLLEWWRKGSDVVAAVRENREGETRMKLLTARWFYRLLDRVSQIDVEQNAADFRLLSRRALDALLAMPEGNRYIRGMTAWVGFTQTSVPFRRDARRAGRSKFSFLKMLRFSFDAVASFSYVPLQLATALGFVLSAIAFLGIPIAIGFLIAGEGVSGVITIVIAVLLLGGIQLMAIGIMGEYLGRVYDEVKGRPLYVIESKRNFDSGEVREARLADQAVEAPTRSSASSSVRSTN